MYKKFVYDKNSGVATATLKDQKFVVTGKAKLHPDDKKYGNELTGLTIAEMRAYKKLVDKRKKQKVSRAQWFQSQADYYNKLAEIDQFLIESLEGEIESFINAKVKLYNMLNNPPKKIEWEEVDESLFAESFKRSIEDGDALK